MWWCARDRHHLHGLGCALGCMHDLRVETTMTKVPDPTVWLTRDSFGGEVEDQVDVWECRPTRHERDGGFVEWLDVGDGLGMHAEQISLADAKIRFKTVPDHDGECIRIGRRP